MEVDPDKKKGGESRMLDAPRERVRELFTEN